MGKLWTGVVLLFALLVPVSCTEVSINDPIICYILDGFLVIYCIVATALFFNQRISNTVALGQSKDDGGIYQELNISKDDDPYQVLEPTKKKKKAPKKKKRAENDVDPYETLATASSAPAK